ncbi:MAG: DUF4864 domain-containing protein [Planctomycetia bacterium]|nr:DUF4864 domain-containing protein [Planctomycetia bacterium]
MRCLLLAALCAVGFAIGTRLMMLSAPPATDWQALRAATPLTAPHPELQPEQVVALQVAALRAFRTRDAALLQCMAFASPSNRSVTGSPAQFAAMVRGPKYRALIDCEKSLIGSPTIMGDQAMVLVTVIDGSHRASVFRFFLTKQANPQYQDCWMTDSVTPDAEAPATDDSGSDVVSRTFPSESGRLVRCLA